MDKLGAVSDARMDELVSEIVGRLHPQKIILFGSQARGDTHEGSDVDLCLIVETEEDWFSRLRTFKTQMLHAPEEIEPHIYTQAEFDKMLSDGNRFVLQVAAEGRLLYDRQ